MKVTVQDYKEAGDSSDKILNIKGVQFYTATAFLESVNTWLRAATAVWPSLANYEVIHLPSWKQKWQRK